MPAAATDWYALAAEAEQRALERLPHLAGVDGVGRGPGAIGELALVVVLCDYDLTVCEQATTIADEIEEAVSGVRVALTFTAHQGRPVRALLEKPLWVRPGLDES